MENKYHFVLNKSLKVCQKLSIASRWHIIGIKNARLSCWESVGQLGQNHTVIDL